MKFCRCFFVGVALVFLVACAVQHPPLPYDANNPLKRVAVLPFKNDTADVDGPELVRKKMVAALEHHSYMVKNVKETDTILRDQMGITLGGQLDMTTAQQIGETLEVEGVLYGTLMDFDETTTGAIDVKKVRGTFKLVNTFNGETAWARGLGVRSEMRMEGQGGAAATVIARLADARDKDVPWVTIGSTTTGSNDLGKSFAISLGVKLINKALGIHLDHESTELARLVTQDLPWGPGPAAAIVASAPVPRIAVPEIRLPEPPSFVYMDWEGTRDFSAVVFSKSFDKARNDTMTMEMPMAVAGDRMRMDMDMTAMMKGDAQSALSKMSVIQLGDKKIGYTLYPYSRKYIVHSEKQIRDEKPQIEKTKVDSEVIDGHPTEKFRVRITYKDGRVEEGFVWNASDLGGMTIKSEVENRDYHITTELRNIVTKTPPLSVFEIPEGYTEAQNYMDLMSNDQKNK